jgi:hypothetical protein
VTGERDDERRELEAAGWEPEEREGETVWKNPANGLLYPQGQAVAIVRRARTRRGQNRESRTDAREVDTDSVAPPWRVPALPNRTTWSSTAEPTRTVPMIRNQKSTLSLSRNARTHIRYSPCPIKLSVALP